MYPSLVRREENGTPIPRWRRPRSYGHPRRTARRIITAGWRGTRTGSRLGHVDRSRHPGGDANDQSTPNPLSDGDAPAKSRLRIFIVDGHALVREGTVQLLKQAPDFEVVGQAGSGEEATILLDELRPD